MSYNIFLKIKKEYANFYRELLSQGKMPLWDTGKGFWGTAVDEEVYEAFQKLKLSKANTFIDLGSGDGKVVLIASLFCKRAVGIEIDNSLHLKALEIQRKLIIPNVIFYNNDYYQHSISEFDYVFVFPDKPMERGLQKKLLNELKGKLILYGHHFHPDKLKKKESFSVNENLISVYSN